MAGRYASRSPASLQNGHPYRRQNVIAGTVCGRGGRVGREKLAWAKFEAKAEGARPCEQGALGRLNKAAELVQIDAVHDNA
jgi:hypothetical protein